MTLTRVNGISLKETPASEIDMAASAPLSTIVHEPLIKSNYEVVLGHDVTVLTQLDNPYWTVVVLSSAANSPVRTVVTTEKSLDLASALAAVHRRSALEVSHFYVAMGKTYDSTVIRPLQRQKKKTKRYRGLDNDDVVQLSEEEDGDDLDNENYTDSSSESEDDVELGLDLSDESEEEDGLEHIRKPSHRRRRETKNKTGGRMGEPRTVPFRQSTSPRMPPPAAPPSTATAPAGDGTIPMAARPHLFYGQPTNMTGVYPPPPPPPPQGHKPATVPNHLAAVVAPSMPGIYTTHTQSASGHPINVFQQPKGHMPPPPAAVPVPQQQQMRANSFYPPTAGPAAYTKQRRPAPAAALPSPAPRPVSINIHWIG
ncbi:unnamed protein product, partial [Clonostachys rosea]